MYASVLSGLVLLFVCTVGSEDVKCASDFASFVSKDCTEMWQCVWGNPVKMPDCKAKGLIYSRQYKVCVWKNSAYDDCKLDPSLCKLINGRLMKMQLESLNIVIASCTIHILMQLRLK